LAGIGPGRSTPAPTVLIARRERRGRALIRKLGKGLILTADQWKESSYRTTLASACLD